MTAHVNGPDGSIANTGTKSFDPAASFGFNGTEAQSTGNLMPDTVHNLIINNSAGVTLSNSLLVNGTLDMESGALSVGDNTLVYGTNASLKYSGKSAQTTTDTEFPTSGGPKNLIIANLKGVTLHSSRKIGNIDLFGKLNLGASLLTTDSTYVNSNSAYVVTDGGALVITSNGASPILFPVGTTSYAPVRIMNSGTINTISVGVLNETDNSLFGGRLNLKWNINEVSSFGDGNYMLQFGWTAAENSAFRTDRAKYAKIFNMSDTTEAGEGNYTIILETTPKTVARSGITKLGPFIVGNLRDITSVTEHLESVPMNCILHNNYPNPFTQNTTIDITINQASQVKLVVCDLPGNEIATLINDRLEPGVYSVQWNAINNAAGIYICKLITNNYVQARKMTLIK